MLSWLELGSQQGSCSISLAWGPCGEAKKIVTNWQLISASDCGTVGPAGLANGALFSRVMANSPGGILPITTQGRPPVFVSAGAQDNVFPISQGADSVKPLSTAGSQCFTATQSTRRLCFQQGHALGGWACPHALCCPTRGCRDVGCAPAPSSSTHCFVSSSERALAPLSPTGMCWQIKLLEALLCRPQVISPHGWCTQGSW